MGKVDDRLAELRAAAGAGDFAALRFAAHRLAGSCSNLGLVAAGERLIALELLADLDPGGASAMLRAVEEKVRLGRAHLLDYRATHCGARP